MPDMNDWNAQIIEEFRANEGRVGGTFEGATMLLLHTKGATTGLPRVNPLVYLADGERFVIFASKGGAETDPDWYRNLVADPDVEIEVGTSTIAVHAEVVTGAEHDALYARQVERHPYFAEYAAKAGRIIPVIALTPR